MSTFFKQKSPEVSAIDFLRYLPWSDVFLMSAHCCPFARYALAIRLPVLPGRECLPLAAPKTGLLLPLTRGAHCFGNSTQGYWGARERELKKFRF